ncbi:MAG: hypothetical protein GWN62_21460, partial [Aliifodinibius sp.]|nr:hypothetical protein [Fodinibius sp.]
MKIKYISQFTWTLVVLSGTFLGIAVPVFSQSTHLSKDSTVELIENWLYRWGDSPVNKDGRPQWIEEDSDSLWNELNADEFLRTNRSENFIWYKTKLPDIEWTNPAIFIPPVILACEIFLDTELIYRSGRMLSVASNKFSGLTSHLIPLDKAYRDRMLYIRIFSNSTEIGIDITSHHMMIGNEGDLYTLIIRNNIDSIIIGFVFVFIGIFSIFVFLKRFEQKIYLIFTFGFFSLCAGLFYISFDHTGRLFIESPVLRYYLGFFSYLLFPVGLYAFVEK